MKTPEPDEWETAADGKGITLPDSEQFIGAKVTSGFGIGTTIVEGRHGGVQVPDEVLARWLRLRGWTVSRSKP